MEHERGFTLIELLIGAALGAILMWAMLALASRTIASAEALNTRLSASTGTSHLIERLVSEAGSAQSVTAPSANEIDFTAQDASHRTYAWSYVFDSNAKTITRSTGEAIGPIDAFTATAITADQLSNPASAAYDPLFAGVNAPDLAGNRLVALQITASGVNQRIVLASADAPTAFTVVVTYTPSPAPLATATPVPPVLTP